MILIYSQLPQFSLFAFYLPHLTLVDEEVVSYSSE